MAGPEAGGVADPEAGGVADPPEVGGVEILEADGKAPADGVDVHAGGKANGREAPLLYLTI